MKKSSLNQDDNQKPEIIKRSDRKLDPRAEEMMKNVKPMSKEEALKENLEMQEAAKKELANMNQGQKQDKASKILGVKNIKEAKSIEKVNKVLGTNFTKDLHRIQEPEKPNIFKRAFSTIKEKFNNIIDKIKPKAKPIQWAQARSGSLSTQENTLAEGNKNQDVQVKQGLAQETKQPTIQNQEPQKIEETKQPTIQNQEPQKVEEKKLTTEQVQKNDLDIKNLVKGHNQKMAELKKQNIENPTQTPSKPKIEEVKVRVGFEQAIPTEIKPVKANEQKAQSLETLKENLNRPKTQAKTVTKDEVHKIRNKEVDNKILKKFNLGGKGGGMSM